jgi:hypothetical protein
MPDTKISALTAATAAALANELPINEAGASKKLTVQKVLDAVNVLASAGTIAGAHNVALIQSSAAVKSTVADLHNYRELLISGNSGTANVNGAPQRTLQVLTSNATANSTTTIATVMTTSSLPAGTYRYRYDIIFQAGALTNSAKFNVDFSGTVTKHLTRLFFPSAGVTAATGAVDQEAAAVTTGSVWAWQGTRADATVLGPQTGVDTINADIHYVIEGILIAGGTGNLLLGHASEEATSTQVMAGTMLELVRLA